METVNQNQRTYQKKAQSMEASNKLMGYGKLPPQAVDVEEIVLGALMLEKDALTATIDILSKDIFYKETHQLIFEAILDLFKRSEPIDMLTVVNELKKKGTIELVGGAYYISQLTNRVASAANIEFHARIILEKYIKRQLISISSDITKDSFEDTNDVFDILDKAEKELFAIGENTLRKNWQTMDGLVKSAIENIEIASKQEGHLSGLPSGFVHLDRLTAGWQKSDLIIIAARPAMGKTAFVLSMTRNIAVDHRRPVAVFSLEMSAVQLATRLLSSESEIEADKIKKGNLQPHEWIQLQVKRTALETAPIYIDDSAGINIFDLRAKCRRLKAQHNIELVIVDYLQLMSAGGEKSGNREQEISMISRALKGLAKELNIPVIVLSQLSRQVETRGGDKRPQLSDLRESGAIEQDADMVCFLYRPEYYKIEVDAEGNSTQGMAKVIVAKHRNGGLEDINLKFINKFAKFCDPEENISYDAQAMGNSNEFFSQTKSSKMNDSQEFDSNEDFPLAF